MELCLYNAVLTSMSHDGKSFTYVNQLASSNTDPSKREDWFTVACCPPNVLRLLGQIGGYVWQVSPDDTAMSADIAVHLYVASELKVLVGGQNARITQSGNWPWGENITFSVDSAGIPITLKLRIPEWASSFESLTIDPTASLKERHVTNETTGDDYVGMTLESGAHLVTVRDLNSAPFMDKRVLDAALRQTELVPELHFIPYYSRSSRGGRGSFRNVFSSAQLLYSYTANPRGNNAVRVFHVVAIVPLITLAALPDGSHRSNSDVIACQPCIVTTRVANRHYISTLPGSEQSSARRPPHRGPSTNGDCCHPPEVPQSSRKPFDVPACLTISPCSIFTLPQIMWSTLAHMAMYKETTITASHGCEDYIELLTGRRNEPPYFQQSKTMPSTKWVSYNDSSLRKTATRR
nr:non-reducing end beta-l-arabinofuranosidase [Quercus suber]